MAFITQRIIPKPHPSGKCVKWKDVTDCFNEWSRGATFNGSIKELQTYIHKKFGKPDVNKNSWKCFYIRTDLDDEEQIENEKVFS